MHKIISPFLFCFIITQSFGQAQRKLSTYFLTQYNKTLHDYTIGNNPSAIGLGLQTFYNNTTRFKPTIELTGDIYLEDDKVLRLDPGGSNPKNDNSVGSIINLFIGSSYHPANNIYVSILAGPGFISGQTLLGVKPSFGFYFSKTQRCTAKISYIDLFNRTRLEKGDFRSVSLAIGFKLL